LLHWIWPVENNYSFSVYLSIAVLLVFLDLIAAYVSVRQCIIIICRCPQHIIEISLSRKNVYRSMLSKMPKMCDNLFLLNFKSLFKKRKIKHIHQNLRFYQTIEEIHLMAVKKIESYAGENNCNI
jgi:hypothetical protein